MKYLDIENGGRVSVRGRFLDLGAHTVEWKEELLKAYRSEITITIRVDVDCMKIDVLDLDHGAARRYAYDKAGVERALETLYHAIKEGRISICKDFR
jgi:hypothetical protein